jgi:hypothetical protein
MESKTVRTANKRYHVDHYDDGTCQVWRNDSSFGSTFLGKTKSLQDCLALIKADSGEIKEIY